MTQPKFSFSLGGTTATPATGGLFGSVTSTPAISSNQPSLFGASTPATSTTTATTGFAGFGATSAIKPATSNPFSSSK